MLHRKDVFKLSVVEDLGYILKIKLKKVGIDAWFCEKVKQVSSHLFLTLLTCRSDFENFQDRQFFHSKNLK